MSHDTAEGKLFLPPRRRLMWLACAYLSGVYLTSVVILPASAAFAIGILFLTGAVLRRLQRKRALFFVALCALVTGNAFAGSVLSVMDCPTEPGAAISGEVYAIEKSYRVYLRDVVADGEKLAHGVVVTLMLEEAAAGGSQAQEPQIGQRITGTGRLFSPEEKRNPGGIDRRIGALRDGYELSGYMLPGWEAHGEAWFSLRECMRILRQRLTAHIGMLFGDQAAIFAGVMLGEKSGIDDELTAAMRLTGTVHILTVSGMHMSMIGMLIQRILRRLSVARGLRFFVFGVILAVFALLTGCAAGTVRALIMTLLREWAQMRGRRYEPLTGLSFAAFVMAIANPVWPLDASFQFSFFVVLGIILLSPLFEFKEGTRSRLPVPIRRLLSITGVSLSAQIAALPIQLLFYGYVPMLSLPMNLLCSLLVPVLLIGGWMNTLLGGMWLDAGKLVGGVLSVIASGFAQTSEWTAALKGSILRLPAPYGVTVFVFAAWMILLSSRICFGGMRRRAAAAVMLAIILMYAPRFCPAARYVQLDVGQGDAAVLRKGRHCVLMDVGPADSYDVLRYLRHEGLFVDAVVLSHLDDDHTGALGVLLDSEVEIPVMIMPGGGQFRNTKDMLNDFALSPDVARAFELVEKKAVALKTVVSGDRLAFGDLTMDVLAPEPAGADPSENEGSLLLYAQLEDVSILLTGDLPIEEEPEGIPDCDVLKVAHHGSKNATSVGFLSMAKPEMALISAGKGNSYGHPHARVLEDLESVGSEIGRTDQQGCITLWLKDGAWRCDSFLAASRVPGNEGT